MSLENAKFKELDWYIAKNKISYENFYVWVTDDIFTLNQKNNISDFTHATFTIPETATYVQKHFLDKWCKPTWIPTDTIGNIVYIYKINS